MNLRSCLKLLIILYFPRLSLSAHIKEWGYMLQLALLDSKCSLGIIYSDHSIFISQATSAE